MRRPRITSWRLAIPIGTLLTMLMGVAFGGEPTAEQIMIRAHQARAAWSHFPGFSADLAVSVDGEVFRGRLTVAADGEVTLTGLPESEQTAWVQPRLESFVAHRQPSEAKEYDVSFADETATHPLGRLIKFHEDRLHSLYRIEDDVIREVHRTIGETRFTISVVDVARNKQGKYLPRVYTVSYWESKTGDLTRSDVYQNDWVRVGEFDLPRRLRSVTTRDDGRREVRQLAFSNHELLKQSR